MRTNNLLHPVRSTLIPTPDDAFQEYCSLGGQLTVFSPFGVDPISADENLMAERDGYKPTFKTSLLFFIHLLMGMTNTFVMG